MAWIESSKELPKTPDVKLVVIDRSYPEFAYYDAVSNAWLSRRNGREFYHGEIITHWMDIPPTPHQIQQKVDRALLQIERENKLANGV